MFSHVIIFQFTFHPPSGPLEDDSFGDEITLDKISEILYGEVTSFVDKPFTDDSFYDIMKTAFSKNNPADFCFMCRKGIYHTLCLDCDTSLSEDNLSDLSVSQKSCASISEELYTPDKGLDRDSRLDSGISIDTSLVSCDVSVESFGTPNLEHFTLHSSSTPHHGSVSPCSSCSHNHSLLSPIPSSTPFKTSTPLKNPEDLSSSSEIIKRKLDLDIAASCSSNELPTSSSNDNSSQQNQPQETVNPESAECPECGSHLHITTGPDGQTVLSSPPKQKPSLDHLDSGIGLESDPVEADLESGYEEDWDEDHQNESNLGGLTPFSETTLLSPTGQDKSLTSSFSETIVDKQSLSETSCSKSVSDILSDTSLLGNNKTQQVSEKEEILTVTDKLVDRTDCNKEKLPDSDSLSNNEQLSDSLSNKEQLPDSLNKEQLPDSLNDKEQLPDSLNIKEQLPNSLSNKEQLLDSVNKQIPDSLSKEQLFSKADIVPEDPFEFSDALPSSLSVDYLTVNKTVKSTYEIKKSKSGKASCQTIKKPEGKKLLPLGSKVYFLFAASYSTLFVFLFFFFFFFVADSNWS